MPSTISYQAAPSPAPGITRDSHTTLASLTTLSTINATLLYPATANPSPAHPPTPPPKLAMAAFADQAPASHENERAQATGK